MTVLDEILTSGTVQSGDGQDMPLRDHIHREEGEFLAQVVRDAQPQVTLEIGLACGISALYICGALPEGSRHIAIDAFQDELFDNAGLRSLERAGHRDRVCFIPERSQFALPRLVQDDVRVDFAFIDGMHTFDYALVDFFYIDMLLRPGGLVAFDDADIPAVRRVVRYALTNRSYELHAALDSGVERSTPRAVAERLARLPGAGRFATPELTQPDHTLGLPASSRCVVLRQSSPDGRPWDFHQEF